LDAVQEVQMESLQNPKDGIPALIGAIKDQDEQVRVAAAKALGFVSSYSIRSNSNLDVVSEALQALQSALKDPAAPVRIESARSIGILGGIGFAIPRRGGGGSPKGGTTGKSPVDARVLADVFNVLAGDSDAGARLLAWQALGSAGPKMGIELPKQLLAGVENEPPENHEAVIKALGEYGPAAAPAIPFLSRLLKEDAPKTDHASEAEKVARALGRVAPGAPAAGEAVSTLTDALESGSPQVRLAAVKALEQLGSPAAAGAIPKVQGLENDPDTKVREAAKSAVKSLTKAAK
jgi:HEAT repeat protein